MKLLALRLCEHDSNISYFDGDHLYYYKSERDLQIKHHAYKNLWQWRDVIKEKWGIHYDDIDEIVIIVDTWHNGLPTDNESFFPAVEFNYLPTSAKVYRLNHHYAHALSTWMLEDEHPEISIVIDGFGDRDVSWSVLRNNELIETGSLQVNGSIGTEMAQAGRYLGITAEHGIDIAGKVMGLQSYGKLDEEYLHILRQYDLYNVKEVFNLSHWFEHKKDPLLGNLQPLDWIHTVHTRVGEILCEFFSKFAHPDTVISYTGGVAQNVIWNTVLKKKFKNLIIPPHCADEGISLGAIEWLRRKNNLPRFKIQNFPFVQSDQSIDGPSHKTIKVTAELLAKGKTVAWYQGNGEIGPRALGNRSIFINPRIKDGKEIINSIKKRENYRPFGAVVIQEYANKYFDIDFTNPFMLYVAETFDETLSAITHVDKTCRIQTCSNDNKILYDLLNEFHNITGCPILLNTSLNLAGAPLAGNIEDAVFLFNNSNIDCLVIGDKIYQKTQ